jgi:hypothetical protein
MHRTINAPLAIASRTRSGVMSSAVAVAAGDNARITIGFLVCLAIVPTRVDPGESFVLAAFTALELAPTVCAPVMATRRRAQFKNVLQILAM